MGLAAAVLLLGITLVYSIFNNGVGITASSINQLLSDAGTNVNTGTPPGPDVFGAASITGSSTSSGGTTNPPRHDDH